MKQTISVSSLLLLFAIVTLVSCQDEKQKAEVIITNANIWTGNKKQINAQAMAIVGDSIIAIGSNNEIQKFVGSTTEIVDVNGGFITPGFIDTHVHLMPSGYSLSGIVKLRDVNSPEEFTNSIKEYAESIDSGSWILEGNWDHTLWGGELPAKEWIDDVTKNNPVFIYRLDGHMALANSLALKIAGIDKNTSKIEGGTIVRNEDGTPTGILKDNATSLLFDKIPIPNKKQNEKAFAAATRYLVSKGVTSVHDMGTINDYNTYLDAKQDGNLNLRIYSVMPLDKWSDIKELVSNEGKGDKWLQIGGLKGFVDGSLGSHTAAFKEPYSDAPEDSGFFVNSQEDLYQWISNADKSDLQVMVHAIGDNAIHTLLNIYERVSEENGEKDRRFRIEHAQHIAENDIERFSKLNIIPSMQPYHAIDDGRWAEVLIGPERIKTTYAFNSLLEAQALLAFGSDWPVAPATPLEGIYAAVTRRTLDDKNPNGWVPKQKISVDQALVAYTKNASYAGFSEEIKGILEPGKLADFVVISEDITKVDPVRIKELKVLQTYVGGRKVFDINKN